MTQVNIYKNPPPKILEGQDLNADHWIEGYWTFNEEDAWEWDVATEAWYYQPGNWDYNQGGYWIHVKSSNVRAIRYDKEKKELHVWFKSGRVYCYQLVPELTARNMFFADSMGQYVHEELKGKFGADRVR